MGADLKRKEARKRKFGAEGGEIHPGPTANLEFESRSLDQSSSKKRKREPKKPPAPEKSKHKITQGRDEGRNTPVLKETRDQEEEQRKSLQNAQRYIVFIGNIPYTATEDSIRKHFATVQPKLVRHRTERDTGKSKGFAFLEFEGYDRMRTCLKLFHHSNFDDGKSPGRKLNVELTAGGGGGKSKDRKSKLRAKNEKLNEKRRRRSQEQEKQGKKSKTVNERPQSSTNNGEIHPSRRSRIATQ